MVTTFRPTLNGQSIIWDASLTVAKVNDYKFNLKKTTFVSLGRGFRISYLVINSVNVGDNRNEVAIIDVRANASPTLPVNISRSWGVTIRIVPMITFGSDEVAFGNVWIYDRVGGRLIDTNYRFSDADLAHLVYTASIAPPGYLSSMRRDQPVATPPTIAPTPARPAATNDTATTAEINKLKALTPANFFTNHANINNKVIINAASLPKWLLDVDSSSVGLYVADGRTNPYPAAPIKQVAPKVKRLGGTALRSTIATDGSQAKNLVIAFVELHYSLRANPLAKYLVLLEVFTRADGSVEQFSKNIRKASLGLVPLNSGFYNYWKSLPENSRDAPTVPEEPIAPEEPITPEIVPEVIIPGTVQTPEQIEAHRKANALTFLNRIEFHKVFDNRLPRQKYVKVVLPHFGNFKPRYSACYVVRYTADSIVIETAIKPIAVKQKPKDQVGTRNKYWSVSAKGTSKSFYDVIRVRAVYWNVNEGDFDYYYNALAIVYADGSVSKIIETRIVDGDANIPSLDANFVAWAGLAYQHRDPLTTAATETTEPDIHKTDAQGEVVVAEKEYTDLIVPTRIDDTSFSLLISRLPMPPAVGSRGFYVYNTDNQGIPTKTNTGITFDYSKLPDVTITVPVRMSYLLAIRRIDFFKLGGFVLGEWYYYHRSSGRAFVSNPLSFIESGSKVDKSSPTGVFDDVYNTLIDIDGDVPVGY